MCVCVCVCVCVCICIGLTRAAHIQKKYRGRPTSAIIFFFSGNKTWHMCIQGFTTPARRWP